MIKSIESDLVDICTDDTGYYTLLSNIYGEGGDWDEFGKVRSMMKGLTKVPGWSTIGLELGTLIICKPMKYIGLWIIFQLWLLNKDVM